MSALSEEEENYVRMALLLTGLSPRAVRVLFDKEFPPTYLPSTLNKKNNKLLSLQKSRVINQAQWNLLFPPRSGVAADSKTFDVTLMICLIRNLTCITPPVCGFDYLPSSGEIIPGADIARIKYYRNYLAHLDESKIDNSYFKTAWKDLSDAVGRLGGPSMYQECENLKIKLLDQSNHEIMLEMKSCMGDLTDLKKEVKELKSYHDELKTGHEQKAKEIEKLKDTVPWNIQEQMKRKLETWKKEDEMFVETLAASHVLQCIKTNSCVTVTASSGVGKTFTVRHVALQMAADGYDILPVTNPEDIVKYHNPNKKTLYVIDDLCGTYSLNQTSLDKWKTTHDDIKELLKNENTKIIASCRLQVYQDGQFKLFPLLTACECNILSQDKSLSKTEKELIAKLYLKSNAHKISEYIDLFDFFPLLCKLYNKNQSLNVVDFFRNPFSVYENEIEKLNTEKAYGKYCALSLCVMFNNHVKEEWLTDDANQDIKQIIENTCDACRLCRTTPRLVLKDELDSLIRTFLKKEHGCYRTIHDKLFDYLSFYFGKTQFLPCLIKNADSQIISERFLFKKKDDSDEFITIVPERYHQIYMQRLLDDWSKGEVVRVFTNINMKSLPFREQFLKHLQTKDSLYQKNLAWTYDCHVDEFFSWDRMNTPLLHCCSLRDIHMVEWCCRCDADVNYCCKNEVSNLYIACKGGYMDIVIKLVENKADINKSTYYGESPLYIACKGGYMDIVAKLLDNKADINKCTRDKESPLYIACKGGYIDIATKLVESKADINKCTSQGESPLYIACHGGYTDIVTKLVDNKADTNKCTDYGESPLYIACEKGYTDIVRKLLEKEVDNNILIHRKSPLHIAKLKGYSNIVITLKAKLLGYKELECISKKNRIETEETVRQDRSLMNRESHLFKACERGDTDTVSQLVGNKAFINLCSWNGESLLFIACKGGYTDIVTKLVDNKADINIGTDDGESPLYIACKGGYTDIVTKLVDNKADINQCTLCRESPLYIACKGGYTDIVTKLVDNKADINIGTDDGESPLYIACKGGYTDIVTKLVDNKADINKCTEWGESPLYIACKGGYTDTVTKLVDNKADINKCTWWRESPLYIACKGGYTDIVTKLVDNKADINQCTRKKESPLYIACELGYLDIVSKLKSTHQ